MHLYRIQMVQLPRWQVMLVAAIVLAGLVTLLVVAAGVFLLMLPVFLALGALAYLFGGGPAAPRPNPPAQVIDAEYRVIDEQTIGRSTARHDRR
jgi:hypothetical protein